MMVNPQSSQEILTARMVSSPETIDDEMSGEPHWQQESLTSLSGFGGGTSTNPP
jgi:hypothetical protein